MDCLLLHKNYKLTHLVYIFLHKVITKDLRNEEQVQ